MKKHSLESYIEKLASKEPVPGGGGVAALNLSLGAALLEMVINLSLGKKSLLQFTEQLESYLKQIESIRIEALELMQKDADVFLELLELFQNKTDDPELLDPALIKASQPGRDILVHCILLAEFAHDLISISNKNVSSDIGVAAANIVAAAQSAQSNILINTKFLKNPAQKIEIEEETKSRSDKIFELCRETMTSLK